MTVGKMGFALRRKMSGKKFYYESFASILIAQAQKKGAQTSTYDLLV
jgi:hypothetical protein